MARCRIVKPEFWTDEKSGMLDPFKKCLFLGMLNYADDEGLIKANPLYLKASIFPYDLSVTPKKISKALDCFEKDDLLFLYKKNNQQFAWIIKFKIHQRVDKPQKPKNPPPSIQNNDYQIAIFKRDGFVCHICGEYTDISESVNDSGSRFPSIDHLSPKSKGGSDYPSNLKTACISCNKGRGNNPIPIPFQEHSENTPDERERERERERETYILSGKPDFESVVDYLNKKTGKRFRASTKTTRRHIQARWNEGFCIGDFKAVVDNKTNEWLNDSKMVEYLRPETLFGTKFESYLNCKGCQDGQDPF